MWWIVYKRTTICQGGHTFKVVRIFRLKIIVVRELFMRIAIEYKICVYRYCVTF